MSDNSETDNNQSLPQRKKMGRPSSFTQELADEICSRLSLGETLRRIVASSPHMPERRTIYKWLDAHEDFRHQYTKARAEQADYYAELIIDEAFDSHDAGIGRLRMDALKWVSSKMAPKKYGDKVEVEQTGNQTLTVQFALPTRNGTPPMQTIDIETQQQQLPD